MAAFKLLLFLFCSAALGAVIPRASVPAGYCCFALSDTATGKVVQQDKDSGFLYFDAGEPDGRYCMNSDDKPDVLWDDSWNACIIGWDWPFQCLDGTLGSNVWTLGLSDNWLLLAHDGSQDYKACPDQSGGEIIQPSTTGNAAGCRDIRLAAHGLEGACRSFTG